ncbi:MAG TPA: endolytic transglycosylase MltG [Aggregatilineales bacterium]|nr:endolytic transglycosylase MltG [Anaerolineales bacterium]HRE49529.1 endolytic transglycosylase MltG [Aggregatilineales bacterium]
MNKAARLSLLALLGVAAFAWTITIAALILREGQPSPPTPTLIGVAVIGTAIPTVTPAATFTPPNPTALPTETPSPTALAAATEPLSPSPTLTAPPTATPLPMIVLAPPTFPPTATVPPAPTVRLDVVTLAPSATVDPNLPTPEPIYVIVTADPCPRPAGWAAYQVQPGDTLFGFQLGTENTVTVAEIMRGNCLENNFLQVGQVIFLPAGAGDNAPKVDDSAVYGDPDSTTQDGKCPCRLRVREGWRLEQIAAAIDSLPAPFRGRDFLAATAAGASAPDYWFLRSRPGGVSLEGYMYPDTYTIENGTTAAALRDAMLGRFNEMVGADLEGAFAARGLSFWQGVTFASIVQRESYAAEEQVLIAGVFYNRFARQMGLASFVTLQYALGVPGNWWVKITKSNINTDTRYNTSKYRGLPPSPISNPGVSALRSSAYPASHEYLYFNFKCGGGGNFYTRTYEEFVQGLKCN